MPPAQQDRLPRTLQDLSPRQAHFCLDAQRFAEDELDARLQGRRLLVAFSGGADSTALLLVFHYLAPRLGAEIMAVHLDHGLRPESGEDAAHCRAFCAGLGIELHEAREDVAALAARKGIGIEEAGRKARRRLWEWIKAKTGTDWVLLGHHLDDLAEDQFMRLLRGVGWPELGGMPGRDETRGILRPLLLTPRAALRDFLAALGASWREDASNADPAYLRNRVRQDILPLFVRENPNYLEAAARLWTLARLDRDELAGRLAEPAPDGRGGLLLPRGMLTAASPALRLRLCKQALERLGLGQPRMDSLLDLERAWAAGRNGAAVRFPGDKEARVTRHGIAFGFVLRPKE